MTAELVLATLLETARLGDSGPATVAAKARRRVDTPGGGQIPGDTPWRPGEPFPSLCALPAIASVGVPSMPPNSLQMLCLWHAFARPICAGSLELHCTVVAGLGVQMDRAVHMAMGPCRASAAQVRWLPLRTDPADSEPMQSRHGKSDANLHFYYGYDPA